MTDPFQRLGFSAQLEECLSLEVEQVLFAHCRLVWEVAASHDPSDLPSNQRGGGADVPASPGQMDPEFERRPRIVAADEDRVAVRGVR